jgi:hypothetical protein
MRYRVMEFNRLIFNNLNNIKGILFLRELLFLFCQILSMGR